MAMGRRGADPYVKASLMAEGRRLKKRKTSIKKNTLNPSYNEALVFDVPHESVHHVSLTIAVVDYDWSVGGVSRGPDGWGGAVGGVGGWSQVVGLGQRTLVQGVLHESVHRVGLTIAVMSWGELHTRDPPTVGLGCGVGACGGCGSSERALVQGALHESVRWGDHVGAGGDGIGGLWVLGGARGGSQGGQGCRGVPRGGHGVPWGTVGCCAVPRVPLGSHGCLWVPWVPLGSPSTTGVLGSLGAIGCRWVPPAASGTTR